MASRWNEVVVDCHEPRRLAAFWAEVLGYHVVDDQDDVVEIGPWPAFPDDYEARLAAAPQPATLLFSRSADVKAGKNRLHVDVNPYDRSTAAEVERLLALGATRADVGQTGDESWTVLADPEGNEFCVLRRIQA